MYDICILIRLYKERMKEVDDKLNEVKLGIASDYRIPALKLRDQLNHRLEVAAILKQFKLANLEHKYEAEKQSIRQNFEVFKI